MKELYNIGDVMEILAKSNGSLNHLIELAKEQSVTINENDNETKEKMNKAYNNYLENIDRINKTNISIISKQDKVLIRKK